MATVIVNPNLPITVALAKFKKLVEFEGILKDARKYEAYTKPSVKRRMKSLLARQNLKKHMKKHKD